MMRLPSTPDVMVAIGTAGIIFLVGRWLLSSALSSRSRADFKARNGCQPIAWYPTKLPFGLDWILANIKAIRKKEFLRTLCERYDRMGSTFGVKVLGENAIFTINPQNIKAILSLKFKDYSLGQRPSIMGQLVGKGIFTTDGEEWSHSRAMLRPNFQKDQFRDLTTLEAHFQDLLKLIPQDESIADLQPLFFRLTLDSATEFLFGRSVHSLRHSAEADQEFGEAFDYSLGELAMNFRLGPLRSFRRDPKALKAFDYCRTYVGQLVDEAMEYRGKRLGMDLEHTKSGGRSLFLHELVKTTDNKERVGDELLNVLVAGRDTTASLLSHMFFLLARNPECWKRLRAEVASLGGKPPSYDVLRDLQYTKFCVRESKFTSHLSEDRFQLT